MYETRYKSHHDAYRAIKKRFREEIDKTGYVREVLNTEATSPRVLYLHVPFCNKICTFCPFHRPDELKRREYDAYLTEEINRLSGFRYMQAPIDAVNFGGGTPTSLTPEQMARVLGHIRRSFDLREGAEISVETSITEFTDEMADVLKEGGVNRLSFGVQTFNDEGRKLLGRRGDGLRAIEGLRRAKEKGFRNIGVDLIYNWPGETLQILEEDLKTIKDLELAGVSFYSLMLHDKTPICSRITDAEKQRMADTKWDKTQFDMILRELGKEGYRIFELTKLIRNDLDRYDYIRIRHKGGSCIGIGHGAGGNIERYSFHNSANYPLLGDDVPVSSMGQVLGNTYFVLDEFINDLQKMTVDTDRYSDRLGFDFYSEVKDILERLEKEELVTIDGHSVTLTREGVFWGNNIIDELLRRVYNCDNGS